MSRNSFILSLSSSSSSLRISSFWGSSPISLPFKRCSKSWYFSSSCFHIPLGFSCRHRSSVWVSWSWVEGRQKLAFGAQEMVTSDRHTALPLSPTPNGHPLLSQAWAPQTCPLPCHFPQAPASLPSRPGLHLQPCHISHLRHSTPCSSSSGHVPFTAPGPCSLTCSPTHSPAPE